MGAKEKGNPKLFAFASPPLPYRQVKLEHCSSFKCRLIIIDIMGSFYKCLDGVLQRAYNMEEHSSCRGNISAYSS